jgi:hypothetical protein
MNTFSKCIAIADREFLFIGNFLVCKILAHGKVVLRDDIREELTLKM